MKQAKMEQAKKFKKLSSMSSNVTVCDTVIKNKVRKEISIYSRLSSDNTIYMPFCKIYVDIIYSEKVLDKVSVMYFIFVYSQLPFVVYVL